MFMLIIFLDRSTEGVLADAMREFPEEKEVLILTRTDDQLTPPVGIVAIPADDFFPVAGIVYVVIANGGTTGQLVPTLKKLVVAQAEFTAWDLQRDEPKNKLW